MSCVCWLYGEKCSENEMLHHGKFIENSFNVKLVQAVVHVDPCWKAGYKFQSTGVLAYIGSFYLTRISTKLVSGIRLGRTLTDVTYFMASKYK